MKQISNKQAFTLVELIVVITILAILWTIAFISLQWYSSQARDSKRLSDVQNIKKSLELFSLNTWNLSSINFYTFIPNKSLI
jgi:prepilin-type N-terminal cleavage/methylation domain-containing protein